LSACADAELFDLALRYLRPELGREVGTQAIALLGAIGDPRALPHLAGLVGSIDPAISQAAREATLALGSEAAAAQSPSSARAEPEVFDRKLREESRECAAQIAQIAAGRATWETSAARRDDLQSIRALALARSGMLRDAVELADVLAWGWRQDPLCGERP